MTPSELLKTFPSLKQLSGAHFLVKYGGAAMEHDEVRAAVCAEVAFLTQLGLRVTVVHGGGKEISRLLERLGLTPSFLDGLRVTDTAAMAATEMVLSGAVNKDLASRITLNGAPALGISGRDGHLLEATKLRGSNGADLGLTGEVHAVHPRAIHAILDANFVPVVSPVGETAEGGPLNLNADYAAAALAGSLAVNKCIFLTDVPGVKKNGQVLPHLSPSDVEMLIAEGTISGGMIPKVQCAVRALTAGCPTAVICDAGRPWIVSSAIVGAIDCGTTLRLD
jgi:acetylglutamate kinase